MIKGVTKSGFEFELDENAMDNMELVDILATAQENDPFAVSRIVRCFLSEDQRRRLYEHHRDDSGRVPYTAIQEDVAEMFLACKQGKNS